MKNERKTEIKVGITTLLAIIIFIWLMGWAKNIMVATNDIELVIEFDNVSGLEVDDNVTVRGLKKGFVKDIYLDKNILVKISVDESVELKKDAKFLLVSTDLMGGKKIDIIPGNSNETLNSDEIQKGIFQPDLGSLMGTIGEMKVDLTTIVDNLKISLTSVNDILSDEDLKNDVKTTLKNLHSLTDKLDVMLAENRDDISTITKNTAELTTDANSFLHTNKDNLDFSVAKLKSVLTEADSLLNWFNYITLETIEQKNNLGKALYNDSLITDITSVLKDMSLLTKIILKQIEEDGVKVDANIW